MNEQHVKGGLNDLKGRAKEEIGHATGAEKLEGEGLLDRVKGKVQTALGDVKDAVKEGVDRVLSHNDKH